MKGTNSSNDRLTLCQNVEINSNEYVSCDVFFSGMKSSTTWLGNVIAQSPRKMSLCSESFRRFIMVYRTIIRVNFQFVIICYDWCCHFPLKKPKLSVITEALFGEMCRSATASLVSRTVNTNLEAQKLRLRQHRPFMSIKSFEQTQQVGRVTR